MSNTAELTPVESVSVSVPAPASERAAVAASAAAAAVAAALAEDAAIEDARRRHRDARGARLAREVASVRLTFKDVESFVASAAALGFEAAPRACAGQGALVTLSRAADERCVVEVGPSGLTLHARSDSRVVGELVQAHLLDRVQAFAARADLVCESEHVGAEVRLLSRFPTTAGSPAPVVEVAVGTDGTARVDVGGVAGPGCEALVDRLAEELQADVIDRRRKPESWRQRVLPPATVKVGR